ncbi:MAG: histidine phosphatase family protein [Myxococcales bacterium]|nr:histidine phosphatase family protein [Myxococcales bacterium]
MITLPPGLEASLSATAAPRVLLLRHADRHPMPTGSGDDLDLTADGEARARLLDRRLGDGPRWALTSPLLRCRRTADLANFAADASPLLGAPGPFVVDRARGVQVFETHGTDAVVRAHLRGETWGCMRPPAEGTHIVLAELGQHLATRPGTGLAVSHDAIVMPIVACLTDELFTDDWLAPLDGLVLTRDAVFWRGRPYEVNP